MGRWPERFADGYERWRERSTRRTVDGVRTPRLVMGLLALLFLGLTAFSLFRNVSATAIAGGPTWPCGSVARPELPASSGLPAATPEAGRQGFLLNEVACSSARDRELASSMRSLLPALGLGAVFAATTARRSVRSDPPVAVAA